MSNEIVVLGEYGNEMEARIAATILEANGVSAQVMADNAGGAYPSMALLYPVRLLVRARDVELARELLEVPADDGADADDAPA